MHFLRFLKNRPQPISLLSLVIVVMAIGSLFFGGTPGLLESQKSAMAAVNQPTGQPEKPIRKILEESWEFYKWRFMVDGAHVASNTYGGTISEGQSYALLKAVWMNDPITFKRAWAWTKTNMRRPNDHLLGWRWGDGQSGTTMGLMEVDNAPDADQDIAYALLLAGEQWQEPAYTQDALNIIRDFWRLNVQELDGKYYLLSGTWEGFKQEYLTLNPSYFAPYVYRKFAQYDKAHAAGWIALADNIYDTLDACTNLTKPKLPPNWCAVKWHDDGHGSRIIFSDRQGEGSRDFSYDAFRVYWRMAMDAKLSPSPGRDRAKRYLQTHPFLLQYWQKHGVIAEGFTVDGQPRTQETSGFAMGPVLIINHFQPTVQSPAQDESLYQTMMAPHYHHEGYWFNDYNDFLHSVIWLHLYTLHL